MSKKPLARDECADLARGHRVRARSMDATRLGKEGVPMMTTRVPRAQDGDSPPLDGQLHECGRLA